MSSHAGSSQLAGSAPHPQPGGTDEREPRGDDATSRRSRRGWGWWGAGCALLAGLPLIATVLSLPRAGWAPTYDEAFISLRAWDVLTRHSPLVGQYSQASINIGTPAFSPGPMLYWALTLPTHAFHDIGPLIGVLVLGLLCLVAGCMAATQVAGRTGGVVVAVAFLLLQWSAGAEISGRPLWNPMVALIPFLATLLLAWSVGSGRLGWWPVLVVLASFCAQAHLMFAPASVLVAVLSPLLGLRPARRLGGRRGRLKGKGPVLGGLLAGLACWAPALWQEATNSPGNLTLLWRSTVETSDPTLGTSFGLRNLGRAVNPVLTVWLHPPHRLFYPLPSVAFAVLGALALVLLAAIAAVGYAKGRADVGAAAVVALVADLSAVLVVSGIVSVKAVTIAYIQYVLWPAGLMTYLAIGYAAVVLVRSRRVPRPAPARGPRHRPALAVAVLGLAAVVLGFWQFRSAPRWELDDPNRQAAIAGARTAVGLVGAPAVRGQRLGVATPAENNDFSFLLATAYQLRVHGYQPTLPLVCDGLDPVYCIRPSDPVLVVAAVTPPHPARFLGQVPAPGAGGPHPLGAWLVYAPAPTAGRPAS